MLGYRVSESDIDLYSNEREARTLSEGVLATAAKEQTNVQAKQCVLRTGRRQEYRVDREVIESNRH